MIIVFRLDTLLWLYQNRTAFLFLFVFAPSVVDLSCFVRARDVVHFCLHKQKDICQKCLSYRNVDLKFIMIKNKRISSYKSKAIWNICLRIYERPNRSRLFLSSFISIHQEMLFFFWKMRFHLLPFSFFMQS